LELSGLEISQLVKQINDDLIINDKNYYINKIYCVEENTFSFRMHHPTEPDKFLMIINGKAIWTTDYNINQTSATGFVTSLRKLLMRGRFIEAYQPELERAIIIKFKTRDGIRRLVCELFQKGNIIVIDENDKILACRKKLEVRHRKILPGLEYNLPPAKGMNILKFKEEELEIIKESELTIAKWIGRSFALPKKYTEEIVKRVKIDGEKKCTELTDVEIKNLQSTINVFTNEVNSENKNIILIHENNIPVDLSLISLHKFEKHDLKEIENISRAIDNILIKNLEDSINKKKILPNIEKIERLKKNIERQKEIHNDKKNNIKELKIIAKKNVEGDFNLIEHMRKSKIKFEVDQKRDSIKILDMEIRSFSEKSNMNISSRIFDLVKEQERDIKAIEKSGLDLRKRIEDIEKDKTKKPRVQMIKKQKISWFERYRWFFTSEGFLAVGGRDVNSNNSILSKYLTNKDLVFHAEIIGSPFFILKDCSEEQENSIDEVLEAVVSFSRAWRENIQADGYWVKPEQIKSAAPSGTYLPKGTVRIQGTKNLKKNIMPQIAIGVYNKDGNPTLMSGPEDAIKKNCQNYLLLIPEKIKVSETAKKVKSELIALSDMKEYDLKSKPLDDFIRVLPASGGKIIKSIKK
jgi:predicted ribosome quality control (RQC) complex YloA/Tae2 family protein